MDGLISRQAAIDALRVAYWDDNIQSAKDDPCIVDAMTDWAIRQVKALPPAQPEPHWIPVTERLPEEYQDVLVCGEGDFIICAQFIKGLFECGELDIYGSIDGSKVIGADTFNVIAWMPLPEPYKGGEHDE